MLFPAVHSPAAAGTPRAVRTAPDGPSVPAALEARLDEFPLDVLLGLIATSRQSGVLFVEGDRPVVLHVAEGALCGGESLDSPLSRTDLADGGAHHTGGDARSLVEDHLLTALAAALIPSKAVARFRPGQPEGELARFRFELDETLHAARERMNAWRVIAEVLPSTQLVLSLAEHLPEALDQVSVDRADWQILSQIDSRRTVADIVARSGRTPFGVCSALYRLVVLGVLETPDTAVPTQRAA